jgi:fluoroquinolone transport system permease protein
MSTLRAFGLNDLRNVKREALLFYMLIIPPLMVVVLRLVLPWATASISETFGFDLASYYPMILSFFFVLQIPLLFGVLVGLLVLDERDDDTLTALRVTPISMMGYALYRGGAAVFLSFAYVLITLRFSGFAPPSLLPAMATVAFLSGLLSAVFATVLATFAANKVEGMAVTKGLATLMLGPLAAYFIHSDWQILFGLLPTYWPAKAFWVASEGETFWPYALVGLAYILLLLVVFSRRFRRKVF